MFGFVQQYLQKNKQSIKQNIDRNRTEPEFGQNMMTLKTAAEELFKDGFDEDSYSEDEDDDLLDKFSILTPEVFKSIQKELIWQHQLKSL